MTFHGDAWICPFFARHDEAFLFIRCIEHNRAIARMGRLAMIFVGSELERSVSGA
jgi:hypothetical protein